MKRVLTGFLLVLITTSGFAQIDGLVKISGVLFPEKASVNEAALEIRGGGKATYWGFSLYSAAFYIEPEKSTDDPFLGVHPKQLTLHYLREIPKKYIIEAAEMVLVKNPDNDMEALRERLDLLYDAFHDVTKGDQYIMTYCPEAGTTFYFNGVEEINIEGADFARSFFGIWLDEKSLSTRLRNNLLDPSRVKR